MECPTKFREDNTKYMNTTQRIRVRVNFRGVIYNRFKFFYYLSLSKLYFNLFLCVFQLFWYRYISKGNMVFTYKNEVTQNKTKLNQVKGFRVKASEV